MADSGADDPKAAEKRRLAEALRANLRRRKAAAKLVGTKPAGIIAPRDAAPPADGGSRG